MLVLMAFVLDGLCSFLLLLFLHCHHFRFLFRWTTFFTSVSSFSHWHNKLLLIC
uniref:Uncharacterized protein n=1 Tax=uncultured marine virus TaxID=186617 RepID=A0A0F7LB17_9VIRU|nr:hypothetical protein [uncultured marine virus]